MTPDPKGQQSRDDLDRPRRSRVTRKVARVSPRLLCVLASLLLLAACPNRNKKSKTGPGATGSNAGGPAHPEDAVPEGGLPGYVPPEGRDPAPENGSAKGGAETGDAAKPAPAIRPPGLDLAPAEKKRRVAEHLAKGKSALAGAGPAPDEAIRQAQLALSVDETSVEAMVLLADADIQKRYYDQAQDILEKALERGGSRTREVHFLLGLVHDRLDEPDKAFAAYRRAVVLSPNYKSALMNLGVHYLRNQRYADAQTVYEKLTGELGYRTAAAWTNLGSAYRGRSAELAPTDVGARNQMILKALATYRRALSVNKRYANAYYNLGLLYLDSDPFPVASNGQRANEMDNLKRLQMAKSYFDQYRREPGADLKRVDAVAATAAKLISREERIREKRRQMEERRKRLQKRGGG